MAKVVWGFTASIDGFIAGVGHDMSWLEEIAAQEAAAAPAADGPEVTEALAAPVGVIISGRRGYDAALAQREERGELTSEAFGGAWSGTEVILTHRPEELAGDDSVDAWSCDIRTALRRAQEIAGERDIQIISADIARQALDAGLIDEIQVMCAPVLLGDGIRLFEVPGSRRVDVELIGPIPGAERAFGRVYRPLGRRTEGR